MEHLRLHDAVVFLAAAGLVIPVVRRLRISPVLGFLMIGLAVGPYGLAVLTADYPWLNYVLITDVEGVRALAELGVVFLLFMIGLELSPERLWSMRRLVFGLGNTQIVVTGGVIAAISWAFGNSMQASVLLGSCLALSSTAVVVQLLIEQGRFGGVVGRGTFAVLLAQDIAVVPILFLVGAFGSLPVDTSMTWALAGALGNAVLAVVLILGVGRLAVRPLFRFVGELNNPEVFMALTLLTIVATAAATHAAGLSGALGAFLAGLLLAESEFRHEIEINIEPFKGLLLGLFFMSVAMGIDLSAIMQQPFWVATSVAGLFAIKALITTLSARLFGFRWAEAGEIGLLLAQGGEFAFVVVGLATGFALLPDETAQFMLIVVGATMFLTPAAAKLGQLVHEAANRRDDGKRDEPIDIAPDLAGHVIIVGYGRTGQLLAAMLDRQQIPHIALDLDAGRVARLRAQGAPIHRGDASRAAMLATMRLNHAAALAICTDDPGATEQILDTAQRVAPHVSIVARARDNTHAAALQERGATRVVPEVLESGLQLGHVMLEEVGLPAAVTRDLVETQRAEAEMALSRSPHNADDA